MEPGRVYDVNRDGQVSDAERFLDDRRRGTLAMIALWQRSRNPRAADELDYWRDVLTSIDAQAARLEDER
jgi:hypothetical protein